MSPTYIGAVFDKSDGLHLFFHQWRRETQFTGAELGYQQMKKGGLWQEQKPFAISALPGYSVFYHHRTVDRAGHLYLSFDYWSTWAPYRESYPNAAQRRTAPPDFHFFRWDKLETGDHTGNDKPHQDGAVKVLCAATARALLIGCVQARDADCGVNPHTKYFGDSFKKRSLPVVILSLRRIYCRFP